MTRVETFEEWINRKLDEWWNGLTSESQQALRESALDDQIKEQTVKLLIDTRCPIGPIFTQWENNFEGSWEWNSRVKDYILAL